MESDVLRILELRRRIARLGENDLFKWWESDAGNDTGDYVFGRLFPHSAEWVAIQVASGAARARHEASLPKIPLVHLFNFGPELERELALRFYRLKMDKQVPDPLTLEPIMASGDVATVLSILGISPAAIHTNPEDRSVCLGDLSSKDLSEPLWIAQRLAGAYAASELGRLVVPYYRLMES